MRMRTPNDMRDELLQDAEDVVWLLTSKLEEGNSLRWGTWWEPALRGMHDTDTYATPAYIIQYCSYGDYDGSMVERANYKVLEDICAKDPQLEECLVWLHGGYGTTGVAVRLDVDMPAEIADIISQLADCPLLCDQTHSDLEVEQAAECWEMYGREDFHRTLKEHHKPTCTAEEYDMLSDLTNEDLDALWYGSDKWDGVVQTLSWEFENDYADNYRFNLQEAVDSLTFTDILEACLINY